MAPLAALELGMVEDVLPGAAIAFFVLAVAKARSQRVQLPVRG